jgi:hypothetical protein
LAPTDAAFAASALLILFSHPRLFIRPTRAESPDCAHRRYSRSALLTVTQSSKIPPLSLAAHPQMRA